MEALPVATPNKSKHLKNIEKHIYKYLDALSLQLMEQERYG